MIIYLTYAVSAAIIITKFFDCITTQRKIKGIGMEMNPIARVIMQRIGIKGTIWLIFAITIVMTILGQVWIQLKTESILLGLLLHSNGNIHSNCPRGHCIKQP